MKLVAYGLILLTVLFTVQAVRQQLSGHANVSSPGRSFQSKVADRETEPEEFKNLMAYQWIRAILPGSAGLFLLYMIRRGERLGPMSPDFQGNDAIDQLSEYLDNKYEKR